MRRYGGRMHAARPSLLPRLVTAGIAALLATTGALAVATPAAAHDQLLGSDPADGATVQTMPAEITLNFSAALQTLTEDDTYVDVLGPGGQNVAAGAEVVDGATIRQPVSPAAEPGTYTVEWRAVSSDGHPISDTFSFTVETVSAPEDSGAAPVAPENDETATAPPPRTDVAPTPGKETPSATETTEAPAAAEEPGSFGDVLPWILLGLTGLAILGALIAVLVTRARGDDRADEEGSGGDSPEQG